jgi:hypothetical protein
MPYYVQVLSNLLLISWVPRVSLYSISLFVLIKFVHYSRGRPTRNLLKFMRMLIGLPWVEERLCQHAVSSQLLKGVFLKAGNLERKSQWFGKIIQFNYHIKSTDLILLNYISCGLKGPILTVHSIDDFVGHPLYPSNLCTFNYLHAESDIALISSKCISCVVL